jgi:uncharacterized protein (TIGR02147 family)
MARPSRFSQPRASRKRPSIFKYEELHVFLLDWFAFLKTRDRTFSLKALADQAQVAPSLLSMVLSNQRHLSEKVVSRLLPLLDLGPSEQVYFESLAKLGSQPKGETRIRALDQMSRLAAYQKHHPEEAEFLEYASHWYHLAIREMARMPGFRADPVWIQERLKTKVPLRNLKEALSFLFKKGYLTEEKSGAVRVSKDMISVQGHAYWAALTKFHRQMFGLATESIENTEASERNIMGFTVALNPRRFEAAQKILDQAIADIEKLEKSADGENDSVYQFQLAAFPLTRREPV